MQSKHSERPLCLITIVTRRPGPGFQSAERHGRSTPYRDLLPDHCAALYRDTVNYINNYIRPRDTAAGLADGLHEVQEAAQAYVLREGGLNDDQADELAFQAELLRALEPELPQRWKELLAVPGLRFLQSIGSLADYEYGLIYLALCCLDREHDAERTQTELRGLVQSWNLTMEPGTGHCSLTLLRLALRGTSWWSQLAGFERSFHHAVKLALLGGIDGAVASASAQKLEGQQQVDWNQACLGLLQGSLVYSIPALPAVAQWRERMARRLAQQQA
jgi:hypothetical protein